MKFSRRVIFPAALVASAASLFFFRSTRNDFFEYCTTRAYGLPLPWRIDNCECDGQGGLTEYPISYAVINIALGLGAALIVASFTNKTKRN
jgi:hypothetical protein